MSKERTTARALHDQLSRWLLEWAYPLWSTRGRDLVRGGFHERLSVTGQPLEEPRRARVQPRQIYCFSQAPGLGWRGDAAGVVEQGLSFFLMHYRRPDGLFRTLVAPDGSALDERAVLYDQAFALLGFAASATVAGVNVDVGREAEQLRVAIERRFKRSAAGFETEYPSKPPLQSNPHMHLFEASLAWMQVDGSGDWSSLADSIGELALKRFIDPATGALREFFDTEWRPVPGVEGRIVEPGHQFEWAWLLLRWRGSTDVDVRRAALRLIEIGEQSGVQRGVAINALLDDLSPHDPVARLWPQTERVKAAAIAARLTGEEKYWSMAGEAARGLQRYLATPVVGIWYDRLLPSGEMVLEPAPASSFYHIVAAIAELGSLLTEPRSGSARGA